MKRRWRQIARTKKDESRKNQASNGNTNGRVREASRDGADKEHEKRAAQNNRDRSNDGLKPFLEKG